MTTLAYKVDRLLQNPERLARMRENTRNIGRPDAARVIVDTLLHEVNEPVVIEEPPSIRILPFRINLADLFDPPLAGDDRFTIVDALSGELIDEVTGKEMRVLFDNLEIESTTDADFYINRDTLALLADRGASPHLIDVLQRALGTATSATSAGDASRDAPGAAPPGSARRRCPWKRAPPMPLEARAADAPGSARRRCPWKRAPPMPLGARAADAPGCARRRRHWKRAPPARPLRKTSTSHTQNLHTYPADSMVVFS